MALNCTSGDLICPTRRAHLGNLVLPLRTLSRRRIKGYIATGRQKHGSKSATAKRPAKPGSLLARVTSRLSRAGHRSRYRLRKQVVEPVFGQVKEARGFRQHSRVNERIIDEMLGGQIRRTGHHLHGLDSVTAYHHRRSNTRLR
jgi:hypothetical protein